MANPTKDLAVSAESQQNSPISVSAPLQTLYHQSLANQSRSSSSSLQSSSQYQKSQPTEKTISKFQMTPYLANSTLNTNQTQHSQNQFHSSTIIEITQSDSSLTSVQSQHLLVRPTLSSMALLPVYFVFSFLNLLFLNITSKRPCSSFISDSKTRPPASSRYSLVLFYTFLALFSTTDAESLTYNDLDSLDQHHPLLQNLLLPTELIGFTYLPKREISGCNYILTTNQLLQAECVLPKRCGTPFFQKISSTWYGQEVGICIGIGSSLPYLKENHNDKINDLDNYFIPPDWYAIVTIQTQKFNSFSYYETKGTKYSCIMQSSINQNQQNELIALVDSAYIPTYLTQSYIPFLLQYYVSINRFIIPSLTEANGKFCSSYIKNINFISSNNPQPSYRNLPYMYSFNTPYPQRCSRLKSQPLPVPIVPINETHILLTNSTPFQTIEYKFFPSCLPYSETSSYSFPGSSLIIQTFETILEYLINIIVDLFYFITDTAIDIFYKINAQIKLIELLVLLLSFSVKFSPSISFIFSFLTITLLFNINR